MQPMTNHLNYIKQIPRLSQVQYDTASQLFYVDKALKALGYSGLENVPSFLIPDTQIENALSQVKINPDFQDISPEQKQFLNYSLANHLGLYDAADALRRW